MFLLYPWNNSGIKNCVIYFVVETITDNLSFFFHRKELVYFMIEIRVFLPKNFHIMNLNKIGNPPSKGQMIPKGPFGVLKFSPKTNQQICRSSKNEFVCSFFGRIREYQKSFRNYLTFRKGREVWLSQIPPDDFLKFAIQSWLWWQFDD